MYLVIGVMNGSEKVEAVIRGRAPCFTPGKTVQVIATHWGNCPTTFDIMRFVGNRPDPRNPKKRIPVYAR